MLVIFICSLVVQFALFSVQFRSLWSWTFWNCITWLPWWLAFGWVWPMGLITRNEHKYISSLFPAWCGCSGVSLWLQLKYGSHSAIAPILLNYVIRFPPLSPWFRFPESSKSFVHFLNTSHTSVSSAFNNISSYEPFWVNFISCWDLSYCTMIPFIFLTLARMLLLR